MKFYRDGIEEEIDSEPFVTFTREGHTVENYSVKGEKKYFVTLKDSFYCAHGLTIASAIADALWKDESKRPSLESLKKEIQDIGPERLITLNEFRVLTGACAEGCRIAMKRANIAADSMTAKDIRDKVDRDWGNKLISILEFDL